MHNFKTLLAEEWIMKKRGITIWAAGLLATVGIGWHSVAAEPVTFGIVLPLTGERDGYGHSILIGMQARAKKINAEGGVLGGRPIVFDILDTESRPERAAEAVTELARRPEVLVIFGPHTSGEFAAMLGPAREQEIAVIAPTATQNGITRDNPWAFRVTFSNGFQGMAMARFLLERLGRRRFALFTDQRHVYTTDLSEDFRNTVTERGGEIVSDLYFDQSANDDQTDYSPALRTIADADPEVLFISAYSDEVQVIIRQVDKIGLSAVLCGGDAWDSESVFQGSGFRLEGSYYIASFSVVADDPEVTAFMESMREAGMDVPDSAAALGYDTVTVGVIALERAEEPTRQGFRDALLTLSDLPLLTGKTTITPEGEAIKSAHIMEIVREGNKLSAVEAERLDP